ncbi:hypothetical protein [Vibrio owensii]|uniref:hypothetical protein n=1 Tax=Vibrio owensii TaxID=696485 RepID=UPI0018F215A9|nr:hypothetical protein [Vibrio owensii]
MRYRTIMLTASLLMTGCFDTPKNKPPGYPFASSKAINPNQPHESTPVTVSYDSANPLFDLEPNETLLSVIATKPHPGTIEQRNNTIYYTLDPHLCTPPNYCDEHQGDFYISYETSTPYGDKKKGAITVTVIPPAKPLVHNFSVSLEAGQKKMFRLPTSSKNRAIITQYPQLGTFELNHTHGRTFTYTAPTEIDLKTEDQVKLIAINEYGHESNEGTISITITPKISLSPLTIPSLTDETTYIELDLTEEEYRGFLFGDLKVTSKELRHGNRYDLELANFQGADPHTEFTNQGDSFRIEFFNTNKDYLFSLESNPYRTKSFGIPKKQALNIAYFNFLWLDQQTN